jgi:hypothetical protein
VERAKQTLDLRTESRQALTASPSTRQPWSSLISLCDGETPPHRAGADCWTHSTTGLGPGALGLMALDRRGKTTCMSSCNHLLALCHMR